MKKWRGIQIQQSDLSRLLVRKFPAHNWISFTGTRPERATLEKHISNSELDMFRLPKEFALKVQERQGDQYLNKDVMILDEIAAAANAANGNDNDDKSKNKDCFPLPKEATFFNQTAILTKFISNFLIQLELISSPTTDPSLVGKTLFASRNRFYSSNGLALKAKEQFDKLCHLGQKLHCDIAPQQQSVGTADSGSGTQCKI